MIKRSFDHFARRGLPQGPDRSRSSKKSFLPFPEGLGDRFGQDFSISIGFDVEIDPKTAIVGLRHDFGPSRRVRTGEFREFGMICKSGGDLAPEIGKIV